MVCSIAPLAHAPVVASEPGLSEPARKFLENVFIYGTQGSPKTVGEWEALRQLFWQGTLAVSRQAEETYLEKIEKATMGGVPVFIATPKHFVPAHSDKVVIYAHGGAFTIGDVEHLSQVFAQVADETGLKVIAVNYRLAPEHPFPAGLDDYLSVYKEVLKQYKPQNIAFLGDSSGGNLCIATAIKAREEKLGLPGAIALFSPFTNAQKGESYDKNNDPHIDYEHTIFPYIRAYVEKEEDLNHPLITLLNADLRGLPPMIAQTGTRDALESDSIRLIEKARAEGVDATLLSMKGIWHGVVENMGIPEADQARHAIADFIKAKLVVLNKNS